MIANLTDEEIIHKLEEKFSRDLSHIVPAPEKFDRRYHQAGDKIFSCRDIDAEAILSVDREGFVQSRLVDSKFSDVLGAIH